MSRKGLARPGTGGDTRCSCGLCLPAHGILYVGTDAVKRVTLWKVEDCVERCCNVMERAWVIAHNVSVGLNDVCFDGFVLFLWVVCCMVL